MPFQSKYYRIQNNFICRIKIFSHKNGGGQLFVWKMQEARLVASVHPSLMSMFKSVQTARCTWIGAQIGACEVAFCGDISAFCEDISALVLDCTARCSIQECTHITTDK